jgi:hypothetical protein
MVVWEIANKNHETSSVLHFPVSKSAQADERQVLERKSPPAVESPCRFHLAGENLRSFNLATLIQYRFTSVRN